jgi:PAS domain S-box-containing protein
MSQNANLTVAHKNLYENTSSQERDIHAYLLKRISELTLANNELHRILDNIKEVFFKLSPSGELIDIPFSAFPIVGHSKEDITNKTIFDFLHPEEINNIKNLLKESILRKEVVKDIRHRFLHRDGSWHWLNTSGEPVYDEQGNFLYIFGISYDITERIEQEKNLRENEEKYKQLFHCHPLPLLVIDCKTFKILEANQAALTSYGYTSEEFLSLSIMDIRYTDGKEDIKEMLLKEKNKLDRGEVTKTYNYHRRKDGSLFFAEDSYLSIQINGNNARINCINDITDRKKAEDALAQSEMRYRMFIEQSTEAIFRYESIIPIPVHLPAEEQLEMMLKYGFLAECNDLVAKQYNFKKAEEVIGLRLSKAISFDDSLNKQTLLNFIKSGYRIKDQRTSIINQKGEHFIITNNLFGIIEDNCLVRVWGTARDITEEIKKEKENNYLAKLIDNVSDAIYSCDINLKILSWNKAAEKIYGISARKAIGRVLSDFIQPKYQNTTRQQIIEEVLEKGIWKGEVNFTRGKDGAEVILLSSVTLIKNEQQLPVAFVITSKDITERKQAEKIIAESEMRFKMMADSAPVMIWTTDKNDNTTYYNQGWLNYTGKTLEAELSEKWEDKIHPDDAKKVVKQYKDAVKKKQGFTLEYRLRKSNGSYEWMIDRGSPRFLEDGSFVGYIGVCFNIQDRKKAEEELFISNERYDLINKATNEAIWDADLVNNVSKWGIGYKRLFGYNRSNINVNTEFFLQKVHPDDRDRVAKIFLDIDTEDTSKNILEAEYRFQKADGTYALVKDVAYLIRNAEGKPIRMVGSKKDITKQKELEAQLVQNEVQKQILISQATLAGQEKEREAISKELHDNMNQIISSTKLFLEVVRNNPAENIGLINRAIENLNMVIQENRRLSKSLAPPSLGDTGLVDALMELIDDINITGKIKIEFNSLGNFDDELVTDEIKLSLYRITQEQTNNIIKYAQASQVNIDLTRQHNRLILSISDNGVGFDPTQKRKGIGITNIINRATLLRGTAEINSVPGKGCELNITIPL